VYVSLWRLCIHRVGSRWKQIQHYLGCPAGGNKLAVAPVPTSNPWEAQNAAGAAPSEGSDSRET